MDSLLEKLTDLKLNKEESKEVPKPVKKTCFLNDAKLSGQNEALISSISKLIPNTQGRLLNEKESLKLNNLLNNVLLSEQDSYTLGSSCELVSQVLTNGFENGIMFVDRKLDMLKSEDESNSYESLLLDLLFNRYSLRRVLLLNFDRNANKSIEKRFYNDSRLLKVSINSKRSEESNFDRIGAESGIGFNVNVELKDESYQNSDFMSVFHNLVLPIAYEFNPEIILISTCFDAIDKSLNAETLLTPSIYAHYLHSLSCLANGKICLFIDSSRQNTNTNLIDCSLASAKTLLNNPCPRFSNGLVAPKLSTIECILNLTAVLRSHWCGLQLFNEDDENTSVEEFIQMQKIDNKYFDFSAQIKQEKKEEPENSEVTQLGDVLESLSLSENRTCLCTDERMMLHYNLTSPSHPERPDRIKFIIERLKEKSLFQRCTSLSPRSVTDEELHYCHETEYIESLKTLNSKTNEELIEMSCNRDSVYYNKDTFESAALATGCLLNVVDQVCTKKHLNGVAVCRPPGHHAFPDSCSGFCFFNSVGIAVRYAQKKYPSTVKKVLILDFDVHHGNGTQEIFKEDDSVLFISLHRYDDGHFYPANSDSNYDCVGEGKGVGFTVNIPWNQPQSGDAEYTAAFLRIVMPVAYQFNPDLVFVSAGFDAALGDPLGGYKVTPVGYGQMTKMLCSLANGNVIMALEGGYNLNSISESMSSCVSMLLGDQCPAQISTIPKPLAFKSMRNVTNTLKSFWSCFNFDVKLPDCEFVKKPKWEVRAKKQSDMMYGLRTRIKKNEASPNGSSSSCSSTPTRSSRTPTTNDANEQVRRSPRLVARSSPKPSTTTPRRAVKTAETPIKSEATPDTTPQEVKQEEPQSNPVASPEVSEAGAGAAGGGLIQSLQSVTPLEIIVDGVSSYAVVPLTYCPHLLEISTSNDLSRVNATLPCSACQDPTENWICLTCLQIFCSRYVRGHMAEHFESSAHAMTLSFSDLSVWCYVCDSYVDNSRLDPFKQAAYVTKFPN